MKLFANIYSNYIKITIFSLSFLSIAQASVSTATVQKYIQESPVSQEEVSIWIAPVGTGIPVVDINSNIPRNPASVAKVITTGAGLNLLGNDYTWKTEFYTDGNIRAGVLEGNLYIKGYGNPYMVEERLDDYVFELNQKGIRSIQGDVILDNSYYQNGVETPGEFDGHGIEPYNAVPNALSINFRTVEMSFNNTGNQIHISTNPKLNYTSIQNNMTFNNSTKCKGSKGFSPKIEVDRARDLILVSGSMSKSCKVQKIRKVLTDAGDLYYGIFSESLREIGGELFGSWYYGVVPKNAKLILRGSSRPLSEQIKAMNKKSNNLMTRQLFLTIGAEKQSAPATLSKSRQAVMKYLARLGINTTSLNIDNGCGLSRETRVSAKQIGKFLLAMRDSEYFNYFRQSLSIAGVDGTLKRRFRNTGLEGNAVGKTGTLKNAKALVGYFTSKNGKKFVYAMLFNGKHAVAGRGLQDKMLELVYNTN